MTLRSLLRKLSILNLRSQLTHFYINGKAVKTTSKESHLGVDITNDFKDDSTIVKQAPGIYAKGNMLNSTFGNWTEELG